MPLNTPPDNTTSTAPASQLGKHHNTREKEQLTRGFHRKVIRLASALIKTRSLHIAWHKAFHPDHESWKLVQFKEGRDPYYHSKHLVTCSKCQLEHTAFQHWPKFNADLNAGYQLADAHRAASSYSR